MGSSQVKGSKISSESLELALARGVSFCMSMILTFGNFCSSLSVNFFSNSKPMVK